jgi:DNA polymerase-4
MKSQGLLVWNYANGIDVSQVRPGNYIEMKGLGNSTTTAYNLEDRDTACRVLLSLCETVGMRLRDSGNCCNVVSISIRGSDLVSYGMQKKVDAATDSTRRIHEICCSLFDRLWKGNPIRHLGVRVTDLCSNDFYQASLLDNFNYEKDRRLNIAIDEIRLKYGSKLIQRSCFVNSGLSPMCGGVCEEDYPLMSSIL